MGEVSRVRSMFSHAMDEDLIAANPFRKLAKRGKGRAEQAPPTVREFRSLLDACDTLGDYAPRMRDLFEFASYTLMRPCELYELRWSDIDFRANQIHKDRRLYRGGIDTPKTGRKAIPLPRLRGRSFYASRPGHAQTGWCS